MRSVFLVLFSFSIISCYTQLPRHEREKLKPSGPLPDVAISRVTHHTYERHWSDSPRVDPTTQYDVTVRNAGTVVFTGSLMINFTDRPREMENGRFPLRGGIIKCTLLPGDSTLISFERGQVPYPPSTRLWFLLRTDSYDPHAFHPADYFGRDPVPEASYTNNQFEFTVP